MKIHRKPIKKQTFHTVDEHHRPHHLTMLYAQNYCTFTHSLCVCEERKNLCACIEMLWL